MKYKFILAIDPSGSYIEGKGTTGWCVFNVLDDMVTILGNIEATKYNCAESYWDQHLKLINEFKERYQDRFTVVMEDYLLYANKALDQVHSRMETPKLIGIIQHHCWVNHINCEIQTASQVKTRWADEILNHKKYIQKRGNRYYIPGCKQFINRHCKDAIRHAIHYATFKNK